MRRGRIVLLAVVVLVTLLAFFAGPAWRLLFHPDGFSMAPAELCLEYPRGKGHLEVVALVEVMGGAKNTALLAPGETLCSAAPEPGMDGRIRVGLSEREPPFCKLAARSGETIMLEQFAPDSNCGWAR